MLAAPAKYALTGAAFYDKITKGQWKLFCEAENAKRRPNGLWTYC